MTKHALYFSHDSNARGDEKIIDLRMCLGWEGYGLYWAIVEMLSESTDYKIKTDYNRIAFALQANADSISNVITEHGLFVIEADFFYSESLLNRMLRKQARSESARESARVRWDKKNIDANALQSQCEPNAIKKEINKEDKEINKIKKEKPKPSETALRLSHYLFDKMLENNPSAKKPNFDSWGKHVDLMFTRDNRTEEQIRYLIDFSQGDNFEMQNILSTAKLRKRFDALIVKVKANSTPKEKKFLTQAEKNQIALDKMQKEIDEDERTNNETSSNRPKPVIHGELE